MICARHLDYSEINPTEAPTHPYRSYFGWLPVHTSADEIVLTGALTTSNAGAMWYNSDLKNLRYYDGAASFSIGNTSQYFTPALFVTASGGAVRSTFGANTPCMLLQSTAMQSVVTTFRLANPFKGTNPLNVYVDWVTTDTSLTAAVAWKIKYTASAVGEVITAAPTDVASSTTTSSGPNLISTSDAGAIPAAALTDADFIHLEIERIGDASGDTVDANVALLGLRIDIE